MAQCVMCGEDGKLSNEHAIPSWVGRVLNTTNGPVLHRYVGMPGSGVQREWEASSFDVTVRRVCEPCNQGWMAKLEVEAKAALEPLIRGESRVLTTVQCKLVTRWFLKTMLFLELAGGRGQRVAFPEHEQWVRDAYLPADITLWMGSARLSAGVTTAGLSQEVTWGKREGAGWIFAIVLGRLVLVAYGAPTGMGVSQLAEHVSGALVRLWPSPPLVAAFPPRKSLSRHQVSVILDLVQQSLPSRPPRVF